MRNILLILVVWLALIALHYSLLSLPYYWDEAGYYSLSAWDFYRWGALIPRSTWSLGHTPLVPAYIGSLWHLFGISPRTARLGMLLVAAATVVVTYRLGRRIMSAEPAAWSALLLALSPLFFAQSSMLHIDLASGLFLTLAVLNLTGAYERIDCNLPPIRRLFPFAVSAALATMCKETVVIAFPLFWAYAMFLKRDRRPLALGVLSSAVAPLAAWTLYNHHATGFWTGNAEYLRYNLYATLSPVRMMVAFGIRAYHLLTGEFNWMLVGGAMAGAWWARRSHGGLFQFAPRVRDFLLLAAGLLITFTVFHSVIGGALLERYLLPVFPVFFLSLLLLVWRVPAIAARSICLTSSLFFVIGWFYCVPLNYEYEADLSYRSFVRLHQEAAHYLEQHQPHARILTVWPASGELRTPFLGYVTRPLEVVTMDEFTVEDLSRIRPDNFDLLYIYSRKRQEDWAIRHPWIAHLQQRYFEYAPPVSDRVLAAQMQLKLLAAFEDHGQWVRIYRR
jgi:4-amino-4-deoxy-L-arabinose transferase-like glycosyltransferase